MTFQTAETLLVELGIETPEEIDLEAIAQYCGATVTYGPLKGCEARILGDGNQAFITVRSDSDARRQRFSIGHELGHWMYDRGRLAFACDARDFVGEWYEENPERRANRYASDLLLPKSMFRPVARGRDVDFAAVDELAGRFRTSRTATAIRLVEVGWYPAILVCSRANQRWKWFVESHDLPFQIRLREQPGADTIAYDLLRGAGEPPGPTDVAASGWIDSASADRFSLQEDSVLTVNGMVLSLLWWRDERQLLALE